MAQFVNMYNVELNDGAAPVVPLKQMHYADIKANRFGAIVTLNKEPLPLSGTCTGTAILEDGSTVPMTGTVSGNTAYIELDSSCYSVEGQIEVYVKLTTGGVATTLVAGVGTVRRTETDAVIDPGTIIPSVSALLTAIDEAIASIPADYSALLATIAPTFDASKAGGYAVGDFVWYSGELYRFTAAHTGAWTGTDAVRTTVAEGLSTGAVRYDIDQTLSYNQKIQAIKNIQTALVGDTDMSGDPSGMYFECY